MSTNPVIAAHADIASESADEFGIWLVNAQLPALQAAPGVLDASLLGQARAI